MLHSALSATSFKWLSLKDSWLIFTTQLCTGAGGHKKCKTTFQQIPCPPAFQWGFLLLLMNILFAAAAQVILPASSYILKLIIHCMIRSQYRRLKKAKKKCFGKYLILYNSWNDRDGSTFLFFLTKNHKLLFSHYFYCSCWVCLWQFPLKKNNHDFWRLALHYNVWSMNYLVSVQYNIT